jgi:CRP-like cAMP-binding protein
MLEGNNLLAALRSEELDLIGPEVESFDYGSEKVLYEPGDNVRFCYFPRFGAVATFLIEVGDGVAIETAMVGREGAVGGIVSQGQIPAYARCAVMHEGSFYRIASARLEAVKQQSPHMRHLFARYADCLVAQIFQATACNAAHTIEQRAAKWLTAAVARTGMATIPMTQEQLASMMGIGRSYASRVLQRLKRDGLINTRRGGIELRDPEALAARACSCNRKVDRHFAMVMDGIYRE